MTLHQLSLFYNNLSIMLNAGVGLADHFQTLAATEKNPEAKQKLRQVAERLKKGEEASVVFGRNRLVPVFDIPLIQAGEKSGRLVQVFKSLSTHYELGAAGEKSIRSGLNVPFFVFALALFVPSFPDLFLGRITLKAYLLKNFIILMIVLAVIAYLFSLHLKSYYDLELAKQRYRLTRRIPFLNTLAKNSALEKFCSSLELMLETGVPIVDSLKLAGGTSPDEQIQLASRRIAGEIKGGKSLPAAFQMEPVFTDDIRNSIVLGSQSGELPAFLRRSAQQLQQEIGRAMAAVSKYAPMVIYWVVMLYVGWTIISLYVGNMMELSKMLDL